MMLALDKDAFFKDNIYLNILSFMYLNYNKLGTCTVSQKRSRMSI